MLVQERCNSSALAMELCLSCTNPPIHHVPLIIYIIRTPLTSMMIVLGTQHCQCDSFQLLQWQYGSHAWNFSVLRVCQLLIKCAILYMQCLVSCYIILSVTYMLTHWGWAKRATISQMTISNAFSWMKMYKFWLQFHWNLFPRVQWTIFHHWFR